MRLLFLIFCLVLSTSSSKAQEEFIRPGAEWHYDISHGSFRQYVHSDTVIHGVTCKRIRMQASVDSLYFYYGFRVNPLADKFLYSSNDTVYAFNAIFGRFTPLYVFNVQAGDTITLPIIHPEGSTYIIPKGDSTFSLIIDSVKMERYDTALLKTVYVRQDSSKPDNMMAYGRYIWNIGAPDGLLPYCIASCMTLLASSEGPSNIRCYSDNSISVKYVPGNCQRGISLSVSSIDQDQSISIYPNPTVEKVFITNNSTAKISTASITALDGRVYKQYEEDVPVEISVDDMPAGTYMLRLQTEQGHVLKKLVIVK